MNVLFFLRDFYTEFGGEKGIIGYSVNNKPIYYFCVRKQPSPIMIVTASIHAREYITTYLLLKQIEDYQKNGKTGTIYFIPMVNPDGVEIALTENPLYKANARGVDLNVNFDAMWGKGLKNVTYRASENFIGAYPFSEPETESLRNFTLIKQPDMTVSYHSKGEEIYWEFNQKGSDYERDENFARIASKSTGYKSKIITGSCGGYKDWCVEKLHIPSLTIEVGDDKLFHPINEINLESIYNKNKNVLFDLMAELKG